MITLAYGFNQCLVAVSILHGACVVFSIGTGFLSRIIFGERKSTVWKNIGFCAMTDRVERVLGGVISWIETLLADFTRPSPLLFFFGD